MPKVRKGKGQTKKGKGQEAVKRQGETKDRPVIYPKPIAEMLLEESKRGPLTEKIAKEMLGWKEEGTSDFGSRYLFRDSNGTKIRCWNDVINRPLSMSKIQTLKQEILRGQWRYNAETIIIGKTELLLNGQHQLIALVLACQEWEKNQEKYVRWWPKGPLVIEKLVGYGVDESDDVVNTMDTCKPRSLADVLYRSEFFSKMTEKNRRQSARMTDYAIRLLWHRTGAGMDAFSLRRTHAESLDFLARHPKLLECVYHVREEDSNEKHLQLYCSPGYLAGMLYLMGCSKSNLDTYTQYEPAPCEDALDWNHWDRAQDFIVLLAKRADDVSAVRKAFATANEKGRTGNTDRWALLAKAWCAYRDKMIPIPAKALHLDYTQDEDGIEHLDEQPTVGGIDIWDGENRPDIIEQRVAEVRKTKEDNGETDSPKPTTKPKKAANVSTKKRAPTLTKTSRTGDDWSKGDVAWVCTGDDEPYLGRLLETPYEIENSDERMTTVLAGDGEWEVNVNDLWLTPPTKVPKAEIPKGKRPKEQHNVGNVRWVVHEGETWRGKITSVGVKVATLKVLQGFRGTGTSRTVPLTALFRAQPTTARPTP